MARRLAIGSNLGMLLLAILLILWGLTFFGLDIPGIILGILAIAAGILILIGR
jgi:hypothetical protein